MNRPVLHIAGCGRAARTVARCLLAADRVGIGEVVNRSLESARSATDFIGTGTPVRVFSRFGPDDWLLIGVPESTIAGLAASIANSDRPPPKLTFHLSGSVDSEALAPLGGAAASIHPLCAFADPARAVAEFPGTWCVTEGDQAALAVLEPAFQATGARITRLETGDKRAYHAAMIAASNFLVTLHALAADLATAAGLDSERARELLCDLQAGTLNNVRTLGAEQALTGPIERGDVEACRALLAALPPERAEIFRALGAATVELARRRHPEASWDEMRALFDEE